MRLGLSMWPMWAAIAIVLMVLLADREQESAPDVDDVGAERDVGRDLASRGDLARRDDRHLVANPIAAERGHALTAEESADQARA
jgi:hypothetical protein